MKRSPLKTKPNREKAAARFARQFHSKEFVEWMQAQRCATCMRGPLIPHSEVSHIHSRGAGGTWRDTIPQCKPCHADFHRMGRETFCSRRGWESHERLSELAAEYAREWEARLASSSDTTRPA